MKEQKKKKERSPKSQAYVQNTNPFTPGLGEVLVATENSEGIWEVANI